MLLPKNKLQRNIEYHNIYTRIILLLEKNFAKSSSDFTLHVEFNQSWLIIMSIFFINRDFHEKFHHYLILQDHQCFLFFQNNIIVNFFVFNLFTSINIFFSSRMIFFSIVSCSTFAISSSCQYYLLFQNNIIANFFIFVFCKLFKISISFSSIMNFFIFSFWDLFKLISIFFSFRIISS